MAKKDKGWMTAEPVSYQIPTPAGGVRMETFIPWTLVKRGVRREVITPIDAPEVFREEAHWERRKPEIGKDSALVRALGLAHYWQRLLDEGKFRSITEIAAAEGMDVGQASRIARLAQLAPEIIEVCVESEGNAPNQESLLRRLLPADWSAQEYVMFPSEP